MTDIEGVPEGFELLRIGTPEEGEPYIEPSGRIATCPGGYMGSGYPVLRKIEKPKRYRPFANAAEFAPHRDRWVCVANGIDEEISIDSSDVGECLRLQGYGDLSIATWYGWCAFETAFECFMFDDGSPFGIEVSE